MEGTMNKLQIVQYGDPELSEGFNRFVVGSLDEADKYNEPIIEFDNLHDAVDWCFDEGVDFEVKTHAQYFREQQYGNGE